MADSMVERLAKAVVIANDFLKGTHDMDSVPLNEVKAAAVEADEFLKGLHAYDKPDVAK